MKIRLDYDDDDDSNSDDDESSCEQSPKATTTTTTASPSSPLRSGSIPEERAPASMLPIDDSDVDDDDDDEDATFISDSSLLGTSNPVTALGEEDSWQFDLNVMANRNDRVDNVENATKTTTLNLLSNHQDDYDTLSKVSNFSEELSVMSMELEEADRAIRHLLTGKEDEIKGYRNGVTRQRSNKSATTTNNGDAAAATSTVMNPATSEFLEKRRQERASRLARARERIAKDKQTAQEQQQEAERRQKEKKNKKVALDMSEEARRDRVYQWYSRCGQPSRKELKRRIASLKFKQGVAVEDVDLLPWNFNGSMINVSQMISMSMGMQKGGE